MCTRDLVARGKRSAPAEAARSGAGVGSCQRSWFRATGRRSDAIRGCLVCSFLADSLPRATVCART
ncbi:hypothetical protein CXF94_23905 [Halomonas sp. Choline-3u-9]|nr:hypothetical protein CXF94_23905 [Halomonas sp. Choline-3u-9]